MKNILLISLSIISFNIFAKTMITCKGQNIDVIVDVSISQIFKKNPVPTIFLNSDFLNGSFKGLKEIKETHFEVISTLNGHKAHVFLTTNESKKFSKCIDGSIIETQVTPPKGGAIIKRELACHFSSLAKKHCKRVFSKDKLELLRYYFLSTSNY